MHISEKFDAHVREDKRHADWLEDKLTGIGEKLDDKVDKSDFDKHENQDEHRFEVVYGKVDHLTKKVYFLLGGLALLEILIGWFIAK